MHKAQSPETTARISCCELHLVAAKRNSKLYFLQTVMLAYLWHRKSASLIAHSGQLSQWNKVRRMEYSLWTKHTHWRESGQTGAGIPLAVQDEQYGDRQECRHRALTLKPSMFSSWNNLYFHKQDNLYRGQVNPVTTCASNCKVLAELNLIVKGVFCCALLVLKKYVPHLQWQ